MTALFAVTLAVSLANSKNFYLNELGFKQAIDKSAPGQKRLMVERDSRSDWDH